MNTTENVRYVILDDAYVLARASDFNTARNYLLCNLEAFGFDHYEKIACLKLLQDSIQHH